MGGGFGGFLGHPDQPVTPFPRPPLPVWLSSALFTLGAGLAAFLAALLLMSCGGSPAVSDGVLELDDGIRDVVQGCDWRAAGPADFTPRDPTACYEVYSWLPSRLSATELADPCDAAELPSPVLYRPGDKFFGYYDRSEIETWKLLRLERLDACP